MYTVTDAQAVLIRAMIEARCADIANHVGSIRFEEMHARVDPRSPFAALSEPPHDDDPQYTAWLDLRRLGAALGGPEADARIRHEWERVVVDGAWACGCERRQAGEVLTKEQEDFLAAETENQVV